ncbi:MAG TPA: phosphoglycolate phosphatase [Steroidobacteraceae bacterium]|jgi:phosphoglycolate phosphatase|nr:phosphoglycolate phosphatase [Steroidobacteraceae bacterium]
MTARRELRGVLFDLDGTLLDTAADMAVALNRTRNSEGLPHLPHERIRPLVSHGAPRLLRFAFGEPEPARYESLRRRFLDFYREALAVHTRLFEGCDRVLAHLDARGLRWGIVTNKPGWLTEPLLAQVGLAPRCGCVVAGDTLAHRKPHPLPLLHAAALLGLEPRHCAYVGDAERDVQAARNAGMIPLVAGFGYLADGEDPAAWAADAILARPEELIEWLELRT